MATYMVAAVNQPGSDSPQELVARARQGDEAAFAALFDAHKGRVYSLCLRMTSDVAEAEDLTQEAFIQVFRKLNSFRGDSAFSTWLYRIAVNTVLMKRRKRRLQQVSYDAPLSTDSSEIPREFGVHDASQMGTVDRIALQRAIKRLPDGYRTVFVLHDVEGYGHREIAHLLKCSSGNSKSQLHKARMRIREFLHASRPGSVPVQQISTARFRATGAEAAISVG